MNDRQFPNSATLFRNDKRAGNEKAPNAKSAPGANVTIPASYMGGLLQDWDGESEIKLELDIAAWTKRDKNGNPYQWLKITPKGSWKKRPAEMTQQPRHDPKDGADDSSIPF